MSQQPSPSDETTETTVSPPPGRPRREGNDSLWKRARRTLGTNSLTFLQPQSRPTGTSASTGPAAPSKRREQVRHAQRTHRQRTQNYIKTLESEVVRLRESETNLLQERDKLQGQVDSLRSSLGFHAIPLPTGTEEVSSPHAQPRSFSDFDMPATVSYSTDDLDHQRLHVNFPRQHHNQGLEYPTQTYPVASPFGHPPNAAPDLPNDLSLESLNVSSNQTAEVKVAASFDVIEMAIDFVLALEHPCMSHIPYGDADSIDPINHIMMVSTPLVARAPEAPHINQTWTTSGAIIKELLNLSSGINLEGEITPVEAWHRLHNHPDFWRLDRNQVNKLKIELSSAVSCCGFGAVLDEDVFQDALHRALASTGTTQ